MDLIFTLIPLWVLVETILFLLKTGGASDLDLNDNCANSDFTDDDVSELSFYDYGSHEEDSGIVCMRSGAFKSGIEANETTRRKLLLAKRLARRDQDRQIILAYFQNKKFAINCNCDAGYDSDYESTQNERIELYIKMAEHIRCRKIVGLDDLSYKFQLTISKMHEYLGILQIIGVLQGVCDDRGNFIYVAQTELIVVSKFIEEQNLYQWPQTGLI